MMPTHAAASGNRSCRHPPATFTSDPQTQVAGILALMIQIGIRSFGPTRERAYFLLNA